MLRAVARRTARESEVQLQPATQVRTGVMCVFSLAGDLRVWKYCILCAENDRWECAPVLVCTVPAVYDRSVYCGPIEGLCTPKKGCDDEWLPNVDDFGA